MKYSSKKIFWLIIVVYECLCGSGYANQESLSAAVQNDALLSNGELGFLKYEGKTYLVSVGVSTRNNKTSSNKINCIKNSQLIAQINLSKFINDVQINTEEYLEKEKILSTEGEQKISNKKYILIIKERSEGFLKNIMSIGRWESQDGNSFFYAYGILIDEK